MSQQDPNRVENTPLVFLDRAARAFAGRAAIQFGERARTYGEFAADAQTMARALATVVTPGQAVATLSPNAPELLTAHYSVPLARAALVTVNTRLAADEVAYILEHSQAPLLFADSSLAATALQAAAACDHEVRVVVWGGEAPDGAEPYDTFLAGGNGTPDLPWEVSDEDAVIAINYTSGTTGRPKGVEYTHRGAYLNSLGVLHHAGFDADTRYLWTLPMFHCNGWCTPWAVTAAGGLHLIISAVRTDLVMSAIHDDGVTHLCGAPTVMDTIVTGAGATPFPQRIRMIVGGAPPSPSLLAHIEELGATVTHAYGMTEAYGPFTICEYQPEWDDLEPLERAWRMSRQGVAMLQSGGVRVVDEQMRDVPDDGTTIGEIVMRGNNVMRGYHRDPEATAKAFTGGWLHSGDLGVMHPDGYIELKDRTKDIIISGGENISSIEVENALLAYPDIEDAAVVGVADRRWGERPWAYVVAKGDLDQAALIEHLRRHIAGYKVPDAIQVLESLPRTSTGKLLKRDLRLRAAEEASRTAPGIGAA
ncbi:acyl-CoA synthetase [Microbacterium sp. Root61]|uniref:AMP-binding protein n=1 Tax=Microbacterium sp. Root61 TaxID=1736570 RepID=UPI0007014F41|nr:AMP-binding protein [Microbacterium sp. Root61]KRA26085.1 acyl-CoA synthetase [Microbacterium sp. Root61]